MHLSIVIHSMSSGGAERTVSSLANHWAEQGWEVTIITIASQNADFYELHSAVDRVALGLAGDSPHLGTALVSNFRRVLALRRVLRRLKPDIVVGMMATANIYAALATLGSGCQAVGSERIHPPQLPLGRVWEWLRRHAYRQLNAVVALTEESACWIRNNTRARHVRVIPNAVAWPLPSQKPRVMPDQLYKSGHHTVLAVGRLVPQKGFGYLIDAFASLAEQRLSWDLVILGEGPERSKLEKTVQDLDLGKRVFLPGRVGNLSEWYERADLYVMSSLFEGFPNTLVEAMAHGMPAVSFDCDTGPREIVRHGVDGLLVPPGEVNTLGVAMARLMDDELLRHSFAKRAIDARERFSMEGTTGMWERLFQEILS